MLRRHVVIKTLANMSSQSNSGFDASKRGQVERRGHRGTLYILAEKIYGAA